MSVRAAMLVTVAALWAPGIAVAQAPVSAATRADDGRLTIRAVRLERPLTVDGALDEDVYRAVAPARGFVQQVPYSGTAATEDTEVWVFFDDTRIYLAARCADGEPARMVANERRRDNLNIWLNDNIIAVLDTFGDQRSAYFFQTNPVGGQRDALIIDETTINYDWNTVWDVRTRRSAAGWTTEMAIPFKSIRYKPGAVQVWGFNVMRMVRRKTEQTLLSPVPVTYSGSGIFALAWAARLTGLEVPRSFRNVEVKPYVISSVTTNRPAAVSNDISGGVGVDARYSLTSSLAADFTYNTDFAQVEIDEQQVNLTRFSLFFPEKRDFFLEGQGTFEFGGSGGRRAGTADDTPIVFYSRRIGLDNGQPVSIQAGGRLMGRAGRFALGAMTIQADAEPRAGVAATSFAVVRVKRDVFKRSNVGLIVTNRSKATARAGSNQVYGVDANMAFYESLRANGYYARSATTDLRGDAESYRGYVGYVADRYAVEAQQLKIGDAFNPEVGFVRRADIARTHASGRFSPRLASAGAVRQLTFQASAERVATGAGDLESRQERATVRVDTHQGDFASLDYAHTEDVLFRPFAVARGVVVPAGDYRFHEVSTAYQLGPQRRASGTVTVSYGGFYGGHHTQASYSGRVKGSAQLAVEPRVSIDWIDVPQGRARVVALGARPTYTITPRMFVSALVQYNTAVNSLETNARWRWEYQSGSDIYVVYTDGRDTSLAGFPTLVNRSLAVKVTRFLRF